MSRSPAHQYRPQVAMNSTAWGHYERLSGILAEADGELDRDDFQALLTLLAHDIRKRQPPPDPCGWDHVCTGNDSCVASCHDPDWRKAHGLR